jgi:hypothetical protein
MRATLLVVFAVATFVSGNAAAQTTALTHATVIDGTGAAPQRDITIVMENGRIREMAPGLAAPPNATLSISPASSSCRASSMVTAMWVHRRAIRSCGSTRSTV